MIVELAVLFCLQAPVPGRVVSPFAPAGRFDGHWGVDLAATHGSPVRASGTGTVTFAGVVAGMRSVTIDHGGGLRSSVSFLSEILVGKGREVQAGTVIGMAGAAHDDAALHFSVRLDGRYVDPLPYMVCAAGDPSRLYLLPPPEQRSARSGRMSRGQPPDSYPRRGAQRLTGWNLRPTPHRPPPGRRGRLPPARARSNHLPSGRVPVAEG